MDKVKVLELLDSGAIKEFKSENGWSLFKGRVDALGKQNTDVPGYTMVLKQEMSSTQVFTILKDEVVDTLTSQEEMYPKIQERAKRVGDYLSSKEGAWGR